MTYWLNPERYIAYTRLYLKELSIKHEVQTGLQVTGFGYQDTGNLKMSGEHAKKHMMFSFLFPPLTSNIQ